MAGDRGKGRIRQFFAGARITRGALYLLFMEVGFSLVYLMSELKVRADIVSWLVATPDTVWREGKVWTLVTSGVLEIDFVSLIFHGFILWMFVPVLEKWWGTKRFLFFVLWMTLIATTVGTLVGYWLGQHGPVSGLAGLDPFIFGSVVAYGILYGSQPVSFFGVLPMSGRQLMYGFIAFASLLVLLGQKWSTGAGWGSAMFLAWLLASGKWSPKLWMLKRKQKKLRKHLRVVKDDDDPKKWLN